MRVIRADLPRELREVEIHIFADWHLGDYLCDQERIRSCIELVRDTDRAYCIINGDLLNNATRHSVSDCYAEDVPPMEQVQQAVELLTPVRDKILAIQSGNHEGRTYKDAGIDLMEIVARQMGLYDRFSKGGSVIFVRVGEERRGRKETCGSGRVRQICYTIYCNHGRGGGRKEGAKAIRLADMAGIVDADIYVHSHTHMPMTMRQAYYRLDVHNSAVAMVDKLFVNSAAALGYGGYGEVQEYKPASTVSPVIYLSGTKKYFAARL